MSDVFAPDEIDRLSAEIDAQLRELGTPGSGLTVARVANRRSVTGARHICFLHRSIPFIRRKEDGGRERCIAAGAGQGQAACGAALVVGEFDDGDTIVFAQGVKDLVQHLQFANSRALAPAGADKNAAYSLQYARITEAELQAAVEGEGAAAEPGPPTQKRLVSGM